MGRQNDEHTHTRTDTHKCTEVDRLLERERERERERKPGGLHLVTCAVTSQPVMFIAIK